MPVNGLRIEDPPILVTVYFHVTYEIVFTLLWLLVQKNPQQSLVLF